MDAEQEAGRQGGKEKGVKELLGRKKAKALTGTQFGARFSAKAVGPSLRFGLLFILIAAG